MKRGADVMDNRDPAHSHHNGSRNWKQINHKRIRREHRSHSSYSSNDGNDRGRADDDIEEPKVKTIADEKETDPHRLAQRQKQIDYGKNTIGYDRYCSQVPRHQRKPWHPMTPDKTKCIGKKVFDGIVRKWRQALHQYDPPELTEATKTVKTESTVVTTGSATDSTTSTETEVKAEATTTTSTAPSHSIYDNFYEDNFDEVDSDDDLL